MALLQNTAEGGTAGAVATAGNSGTTGGGSGNPATVVTANALQFAADGSHGLMCYETVAQGVFSWFTTSATSGASRFYFKLLTAPTAAGVVHRWYSNTGATGDVVRLLINTSRQLAIQNAAATQVGGGATAWALTVGTWYRIETQVVIGSTTSNGSISMQLFVGDSTTAAATFSAPGTSNTGTAAIVRVDYGRNSGTWSSGPRMDDIAYQDGSATAIGPYVPPAYAGGQFLPFFG